LSKSHLRVHVMFSQGVPPARSQVAGPPSRTGSEDLDTFNGFLQSSRQRLLALGQKWRTAAQPGSDRQAAGYEYRSTRRHPLANVAYLVDTATKTQKNHFPHALTRPAGRE
jgi:spore germination protein YaaH